MRDRTIHALIIGGTAAVFLALTAAVMIDCSDQRECRRAGAVERYNYRTVLIPTSCGSGCTVLVPTETSEWRCVMPAERAP